MVLSLLKLIVHRKFDVVDSFVEIENGVRFIVIIEDCETGCEDCNSLIALQATKTAGMKDSGMKHSSKYFCSLFYSRHTKNRINEFFNVQLLLKGANQHM